MNSLSIDYAKEGIQLSASLTGSLINLEAINLKGKLSNKISQCHKLIVDLTKVTDIDTTGVNSLLSTQMHCAFEDKTMILRCQSDHPVKKLLKLTAAENEFDFITP